MICPTCEHSGRPGYVRTATGDHQPCSTCQGSAIASCCDGAVPCDEDLADTGGSDSRGRLT